jgi:hypothetical protein
LRGAGVLHFVQHDTSDKSKSKSMGTVVDEAVLCAANGDEAAIWAFRRGGGREAEPLGFSIMVSRAKVIDWAMVARIS